MTEDSIDFGLLSHPVDGPRMALLVAAAREILDRSGLRTLQESPVHPVSHATSSCSGAVADDGTLVGYGNITIADASVLPFVPHETPAASVTIEALRIARHLGEGLS